MRNSFPFKAGKYLVTDPAYALSDDYMVGSINPLSSTYENCYVFEFNGYAGVIFHTGGDGSFVAVGSGEINDFEIGVDSGRIALLPLAIVTLKDGFSVRGDVFANELFFSHGRGLGSVIQFDEQFECSSDDRTIYIGNEKSSITIGGIAYESKP